MTQSWLVPVFQLSAPRSDHQPVSGRDDLALIRAVLLYPFYAWLLRYVLLHMKNT